MILSAVMAINIGFLFVGPFQVNQTDTTYCLLTLSTKYGSTMVAIRASCRVLFGLTGFR